MLHWEFNTIASSVGDWSLSVRVTVITSVVKDRLTNVTCFQSKFDEIIQFREKALGCLGDVIKYIEPVLSAAGPPDLLR